VKKKPFGDGDGPPDDPQARARWEQALARWEQELERLQALYDPALDRAQAAHRLRDGLIQQRDQSQAELDAVNGQIPAAQAAAEKARNLVAELATRIEEHRTARDAATARLLGMVQTKHPLVLLPVRLETRFVARQASGGGVDFLIRIYPDDLHIDAHEPGLTEEEERWGKQFWQHTTAAGTEAEKKAAWQQLCDRFGVRRAAWIARVLEHPPGPVPRRDGAWTRAPETSVLPDRWVAVAYSNGRPVFTAWGNPIADRLAAGLSPQATATVVEQNLPPVDARMRWMLDFEAAVAEGMGLRVALTGDLAQNGFDRLLVVGVNATLDAPASATRLTALFDAQHYTHDLAFVPQNTPTNNTAEAASGYASGEPGVERDYEVERGNPLVQAGDRSDGDAAATALGISSEVFAHVRNANGTEQRCSQAMNRALWPVLDGPLLRQLTSVQVPAAFLREHWVEHVRARGPLASMRVGNQPYGLLPVTSLNRWRAVAATPEEAALVNALGALRQVWTLYGRSASRIELGTDLPALLRQEATSCRYFMTHLANGASPVGDPLLLRRSPTPPGDAALHRSPSPNYLSILRRSNAETIRNESFPQWNAKNAPKPHSLLYLFLRQAALRLFDAAQAPELAAFQQSLALLENLSVEALQFLMAETLDLSTYRLDAWITSLATKRLKALRRTLPLGLRLGGYGWLEKVRPGSPLRQVPSPPGVTAGPLYVSEGNKGFVHAPSLAHAATAAVLRSGYLSHQADAQGDPLAIDLSSERVHRAKWVLDGVRQGQSLGALLGYRFERGLHDKGLDRYIAPLRALAGLKQEDALAKAYENLRQAETLAEAVGELYKQSGQAMARAQVAGQRKKQFEGELLQYQDEVDKIAKLKQAAKDAGQKVTDLDAAIALQKLNKPRSAIRKPPGPLDPRTYVVEVLDEGDLDAWSDQLTALQQQRQGALDAANLAHRNFNERVNVRDSDLAKINALTDRRIPNSIPALQVEIETEEATTRNFDRQTLAKEGTRGKAEADLEAARTAFGELLNQQWQKALESLAANNVVDGLELQRRWKAGKRRQPPQQPWDATTIPFGSAALGFPAAASQDFNALDAQLQALDEMVDAVSDVIVAESVYHLVQGNPLRSGATLDAIATGAMAPPELEVVHTPRTGIGLTHRLLTLWSSSLNANEAASQWGTDANQVRAQAEPLLNAWAAKLLGNPARVRCRAEYVQPQTGRVLGTAEVALSTLHLSALDVVFLAEGDEEAHRSELEQRLVYQLLRTKPPSISDQAEVRLSFTRDPAWQPDVVDFGELVEVARTVRKLIAGARAIDGRDLSLPEAPLAPGLDADELALRADRAVGALNQAQQGLQALLGSAPATPPELEKLRAALIRMAYFGVQGAVPLSAIGNSPDKRTALLAQAQSVAKEVSRRLEKVGKMALAGGASAEAKRDYHLARMREILGPDFRILPRFTPANGSVLNQAFGDSAALQANDQFAATTWFQRLARVRDGVAQLDSALLYAEAMGDGARLTFQVGQLPYQAHDRWVALPPGPNQRIPGGRLSLVAHVPTQTSLDFSKPLVGLLIDEWVEVVPSDRETTGLTFHYDQPSACAPQAVLMAVASDDTRAVWDLDMLAAVLQETFDLAQLRAVSLNGLAEASWVEDRLPAGATPHGDGENWNWVNTDPVPFSGGLAHQSAVATGMHQHFFEGATETMLVGPGEMLYVYVFLDPSHLPKEVMLQWNDGSWEHRAYWGENNIAWGVDGTASRRFMGPLPPAGQWVRLEVPADLVGLKGREVTGMAFTLWDGRATWDRAGKGCRPALTFDADAIDLSRAADTTPPGG
jgi:hypothetical protein